MAHAPMHTVIAAAETALRAVGEHNRRWNDPNGNGSGDDAQSPTGDDYNVVLDHLAYLSELLNIDLGWSNT